MASKMAYPSKTSRSRTKEPESEKTTITSKRSSSIPTPSGSTSTTISSKTTLRKAAPSSTDSSRKSRSFFGKQSPKPVERRFPLYTPPSASQPPMGSSTYISAEPATTRRLRRKASSEDHRSAFARSVASHEYHAGSEASKDVQDDVYPDAVLGISLPQSTAFYTPAVMAPEMATSQSRMQSFLAHGPQPPQPVSTPELKTPTPNFARSHSASTGLSESPSPFSHYSRESTPTSVSSASPALSQLPRFQTRRGSSPTRAYPPITRRKIIETKHEPPVLGEGLSSVRETSNPGSSASSLKGPESLIEKAATTKKRVLTKPPPNPPQRSSSKSTAPSPSIDAVSTRKSLPRDPSFTRQQSRTRQPLSPPPRPSRDGTSDFDGFGRTPVVQSNLSYIPASMSSNVEAIHKTTSQTTNHRDEVVRDRSTRITDTPSGTNKQNITRGTGLKQPSVTSPHLVPRETFRSREPSVKPPVSKPPTREPSPAIASSPKPTSRFGLFSRKPKPPVEAPPVVDKTVRKGPSAGTGHEGYGRYARRGRSSSTSTAASRGRSTSIESTAGTMNRPSGSRKSSFNSTDGRPELDDFLKDRLEPVIIGGGGKIRENRNSGIPVSIAASQTSTLSVDSIDQPRVLYRQDPDSNVSVSESVGSTTLNSLASVTGSPVRPTLAHRRSLHRIKLSGEASGMKLPAPIDTKRSMVSSEPGTYDSTLSSAPATDASGVLTDVSEGNEGNWLRPKKKSTTKTKTSRKWNIFHRGHRSTDSIQSTNLSRQPSNDQPMSKVFEEYVPEPIAHYALSDDFDSDQADTMEEQLKNIEDNLDLYADEYGSEVEPIQAREPSMLLPSPPKFPAHFETLSTIGATTNASPNLTNVALNQRPRLQQVGRIPRVPSKRERLHKPSPRSFSRPFTRNTDGEDNTDSEAIEQQPIPVPKPKLGLQTNTTPGLPRAALTYQQPASAPPTNAMLHNLDGEQEFLHFSPRKWSEVSTANSSGTMSLAAITALISPPDAVLSDDEVWGEFDDLLDHVTSPLSMSPQTPGLVVSKDFIVASMSNAEGKLPQIQASSNGSVTSIEMSDNEDEPQKLNTPPRPGLLNPLTLQPELQSPLSLSDLYNKYGAGSSTTKSTVRNSVLSTISGSQYSSQTPISRSESQSSTLDAQTKRVTQVMAEKTRCTSPDSLRFSALMTSRWLSFDRVLFSPIQEQIRTTRQDKILVVDGLGNDDWSTYCALTYPDATVHSLSSMTSRGKERRQLNPDNWTAPSNHRRHTYTDVNAPFPFVKNWFSAVVFRFPAANTPNAYRHAISECKRVLRPGGYLELSVLDMDMVNMGTKTSHAVRNLKMYMHESRPDISLSPVSDEVLKLLSKKGFENVSRAVVGVPVVGSRSESPSKQSDIASPYSVEEATRSLGDMLVDQTQAETLHYPSTKAMARAGRWWWSKCYESLGRGRKESIWEDDDLLQECEARETGLKLFVCYAQKPVSTPRRTNSV